MPLQKRISFLKICTLFFVVVLTAKSNCLIAQTGIHDTIMASAVIYNGDTIEAKTLSIVDFYAKYTAGNMSAYAKWNRLRNAVYVTYPYAVKAGAVLNDINSRLAGITDKSERKKYIKSREKELKKEFTDPLSNLSVYQGRVLMKLINRETGDDCYEIIKEYKGGLTARFYQTVAFFYSTSLKQPYDPGGDDVVIERFVQEVCRNYGYRYTAYRMRAKTME